MSRFVRSAFALAFAATFTSCVFVADDRADRDDAIGIAQAEQSRVVVKDGAALVRELVPGRIRLRGNAPELTVEIVPGAARGAWEVTLENVLADAVLEGAPLR